MTVQSHQPQENIRVERTGAVLTVRIDRQEALGALSRSMVETFEDLTARIAADETVRAVVLTGTGRAFIAGADIGEYDGVTIEQFTDYQHLSRRVFDSWAALPPYTIAAVNGWALGGGFEFALCCDEILAVAGARFGLPEIKLGLLPGGGGTQRLARALGTRFAKRMVVTGEFADAVELHRRGLVSDVFADADALLAGATAEAEAIAANAPLSVRAGKRVIDRGAQLPLAEGLGLEQDTLVELFRSEDAREGVRAFLAKETPRFAGR